MKNIRNIGACLMIFICCFCCTPAKIKNKAIIKQTNLFDYHAEVIKKNALNFYPALDNTGTYYQSEYEKMDQDLAKKVRPIFERVRKASDESANRIPRLILLNENVSPYVFSLNDGSIILCRKVIELCYHQVDKSLGDARLAFVLGHELAHLARDDFWMLKQRQSQDIDTKTLKKQELRADEYGFIYASIAGFPVNRMVKQRYIHFFQDFSEYISDNDTMNHKQAFNTHPVPQQRGEALYQKMLQVKDNIEIYKTAVRLYQLGKYDLALAFFRYFCEIYPSREVLNNMGLVHYEKAMNILAACDDNLAYRFYLLSILDRRTNAEMFVKQRSNCLENDTFKYEIEAAIRLFKRACDRDADYLPSRINLSSALIASGYQPYYTRAESILLQVKNNNERIQNNLAIVRYLIDAEHHEKSIQVLQNILVENPDFFPAQYNLARIRSEQNGYDDPQSIEAWENVDYMKIGGGYAKVASRLHGNALDKKNQTGVDLVAYNLIEPGFVTDEKDRQMETLGLEKKYLPFGDKWNLLYLNNDIRTFVYDRNIIFVEHRYEQDVESINEKFGLPKKIHIHQDNTQTFVYDNFALDFNGNEILRMVRY
jgi:tetratricopeptide (TPR) repeat protein